MTARRKSKPTESEPVSPKEPGGPRRGAARNPSPKKGPIVVAIGASAGGLPALQSFFDALPPDTGMSFVVVTHLHPEHESHLAELLRVRTAMSVTQLTKKTAIRPDHVYVLPPNRRVLLTDSHLNLAEFDEPHGRRTPIDQFFRSIAAAHRDAIGIILSGSGTDGSVGIKDIKADGGLLLVQSPEDAQYDGMPRAAISTGLADLVLPAAELAAKLVEFSRQEPEVPSDPEKLTERQMGTMERILAQVHVRTGNDFTQYKRSTILRRIQRRMQLNGVATLEGYLAFLRQNGGEATAMFNDILIGVTNFFRDRPSWDALGEKVIPALFEGKEKSETVRVWSIGCATGEEAYGLAIMLLEHARSLDRSFQVQVFASDLAEAALAHAREGIYPAAIEADVAPERLDRFFTQENSHYRVKQDLRNSVIFTNHNVLRDPPFSHIDLIVCRNLLIYLQREVQENIFEIFHYALNPGRFLFLGNSESADAVPDLFTTVDQSHRIYRAQLWRGRPAHLPTLPLSLARPPSVRDPSIPRQVPTARTSDTAIVLHEEHVSALEESGAPSILIDAQYNVLHVSETAGRFLLQPKGVPTRELLNLVRKELQTELRGALFQAFERERAAVSKPVWVQFNGYAHRVVVAVRPRSLGGDSQRDISEKQALVLFLEDEFDEPAGTAEGSGATITPDRDPQTLQLEGEVRRLREQLQSVVEEYNSSNEEMKAANEELQSINEEYRSTTEELETSKEELQSVNEELQTVNNELKSNLEETQRTNSDLENLMAASEIATLFLSRELHVKRYTTGMDQVLDLLPSDRGRPVSHFANKLGYEGLVADAEQVVQKLVTIEREISGQDGKWFQVRMRPYRTVDHRIDGVVVTFVDITAIKQAQQALENINETLNVRIEERTRELDQANQSLSQANELFSKLFSSSPIPTALNRLEDWEFLEVNEAYLSYFGRSREDVIGRTALEFGFARGVEFRAHLRERLIHSGLVRDLELELEFPPGSGETRTVLGSMQRVVVDGEERVISSFMDISERIRAERQIRRLASELTVAEQEERHRVSQVLHDELQQRLFALRMQLSFLHEAYEENRSDSLKVDLPELEKWLSEAIETTRSLSIELSPMILKEQGLVEALRWLGTQMNEKFGLEVAVLLDGGDATDIDYSLRILLYRSVRELLFNVVKHSGATEAVIRMEHADGRLRITVSDHGRGFNASVVSPNMPSSHGLGSIKSKLALLGCDLQVNSEPGNGTQVTIAVPVAAAPGAV